jgi:hypothetical protein
VSKREDYARTLRELADPEPFLREHSGLPGPRGNIELGQAASDVCPPELLWRWAGSDDEFLAFCGVLGLGRLLVEGDPAALAALRRHAADGRWRVREAVAMALQRWGEQDFAALATEMARWADGGWLERRAAAAALCEPVLLTTPERVTATLAVLETATPTAGDRSPEYKALRKGLGYCWSVAVAADPEQGRPALERLVSSEHPDVRWIARENLRKKRLASPWAAAQLARLG